MVRRADGWTAAGFGAEHARAAQRLLLAARTAHDAVVKSGATVTSARDAAPLTFYVPGRLEVLGKHTDYAGGRSVICAVERGLCTVATPRDDGLLVAVEATGGSVVTMRLAQDGVADGPAWRTYVETPARRIARHLGSVRRGVTLSIAGDLPMAAGLSSSSALLVSCFLAIATVNGLERDERFRRDVAGPLDLATLLSCVENGQTFKGFTGDAGVGTQGGSEDHVAMLCGVAGALGEYSFCPVRHEGTVPLDDTWTFVIGVSGVVAEKTGAARDAYNRAARMAARLLTRWRIATGRDDASLAAALASSPDAQARLRQAIAQHGEEEFPATALLERLAHFVEESGRLVPVATDAFARGDVPALGLLADRSQAAAEDLLHNQVPETSALARLARETGAAAASAFGAGFGGSVWALVPAGDAAAFTRRWSEAYARAFPHRRDAAQCFTTRPGPAAVRLG
jgi:galactokinase